MHGKLEFQQEHIIKSYQRKGHAVPVTSLRRPPWWPKLTQNGAVTMWAQEDCVKKALCQLQSKVCKKAADNVIVEKVQRQVMCMAVWGRHRARFLEAAGSNPRLNGNLYPLLSLSRSGGGLSVCCLVLCASCAQERINARDEHTQGKQIVAFPQQSPTLGFQ